MEDRLGWIFDLYDLNKDGKLTRAVERPVMHVSRAKNDILARLGTTATRWIGLPTRRACFQDEFCIHDTSH